MLLALRNKGAVQVMYPVLDQLLSMPMMIIVSKHMPLGVEATIFALMMGLANLGTACGNYGGVVLLELLGRVEAPEFNNIEALVVIRSLLRVLPIAFIPYLVPLGSPRTDAGARKAPPPELRERQPAGGSTSGASP